MRQGLGAPMYALGKRLMNRTPRIVYFFSPFIKASIRSVLSFVFLLCLSGVALHAEASDKKASREREALRRIQQQLSVLQGEMAVLEQDKAKLSADLDKASASLKAEEGRAARLQRGFNSSKQQLASLTTELTLAKEELSSTAKQLAETRKTLEETTRALQQSESEKRGLETVKARREREIASCESKNIALYEIGRSLMDRYENKTCSETLAQKEPFTGFKKVETENLLEEYRDKLDEQKLIKPPGG